MHIFAHNPNNQEQHTTLLLLHKDSNLDSNRQLDKEQKGAMSNLLAIDFKRTETLSMTKALSDYISTSYAEHPDTYQDDFRVLDELRADIVNLEPHQNALNRLLKYVSWINSCSTISR